MFLREIKSKGSNYLALVENVRENGKIKQKQIAYFGKTDKINKKEIENMIKKLQKIYDIPDSISGMKELARKNYGAKASVNKIWELYKLDGFFSEVLADRKIKYDVEETVKLMVINRLISPRSKLGTFQKKEYYCMEEVELQNLYRVLNLLKENKEEIEKHFYRQRMNLFNSKVDIVLYDVTTLAFESQKTDELRNFGYSKDKKFNETQVVLGMSVDKEGYPVSFNVFEGNKYEGHTLEKAIEDMKNKYQIDKVIIVADRGMLNKDNIKIIEESKYEYIVGKSIKNLKKEAIDEMFNESGYDSFYDKNKEIIFKVKEVEYEGKRLILSYSTKRGAKDRKDRERLIEKAKKMIEKNTAKYTVKRGAGKYILTNVETSGIDISKIEEDAKYDGYFGIITNTKDLKPDEIVEQYHTLWKIEESFRTFKGFLETRPMFHWTQDRIIGHMVMCFMTYNLLKTLENTLKEKKIEYSHEKIREALESLQFSEVEINNKTYALVSKPEGLAKNILTILKINEIPSLMELEIFRNKYSL